jgi:COP9 signalosome complex subunit 3
VHGSTARLHTTGAPILPLGYVAEFCRTFVPEQARYVPERGEAGFSLLDRVSSHVSSVTLLASGIPLLAEAAGNVSYV